MREMIFEDSLYPKLRTIKNEQNNTKNIIYDKSKMITFSGMIYRCYQNDLDCNVIFLDSVGNVKIFLNNITKGMVANDELIFMDLPIDNVAAINRATAVLDKLLSIDKYNIIPVLVPCIEYCAILKFGDKSKPDYNVVKQLGLYRETDTFKNNMSQNRATFERYCKAAAGNVIPNKYRSTSMNVAQILDNTNISIDDCWGLVHQLPLFFSNKTDMLPVKRTDPRQVSRKAFYRIIEQSELYRNAGYDNIDDEAISNIIHSYEKLYKSWF